MPLLNLGAAVHKGGATTTAKTQMQASKLRTLDIADSFDVRYEVWMSPRFYLGVTVRLQAISGRRRPPSPHSTYAQQPTKKCQETIRDRRTGLAHSTLGTAETIHLWARSAATPGTHIPSWSQRAGSKAPGSVGDHQRFGYHFTTYIYNVGYVCVGRSHGRGQRGRRDYEAVARYSFGRPACRVGPDRESLP